MRTSILFFAAFLFFHTSIATADTTYTVRRGDTLLKISDRTLGIANDPKDQRRFDLAKKIRALNPQLKDWNQLSPGDKILLPDVGAAAKPEVAAEAPAPKPMAMPAPPVVEEPAPAPVAPIVKELPPPPPADEIAPVVAQPQAPPPPPAPRASRPAPIEQPSGGGASHNFALAEPSYKISNFKVKEKSTSLESEVKAQAMGLAVGYGRELNEKLEAYIKVGVEAVQFGSFAEATKTLNTSNLLNKNATLGIEYELLPSLSVDVAAKVAERTFVLPVSTDVFDAKSILIPSGEVSLSWDFVRARSFALGAYVAGEYLGSADKDGVTYESIFETEYGAYVKSNRGEERLNYRLTIIYDKTGQGSNIAEQDEEGWLASVELRYPF